MFGCSMFILLWDGSGPLAAADDRLIGGGSRPGTSRAGEKVARPTTNAYGPPGTTGVDRTAGATPGDLANALMDSEESAAKSLTRDLKVNPASAQP